MLWGGSDVNKTSARGKKHAKPANSSKNIFVNVCRTVGSVLIFLLSSIGRLFATVFGALFNLVRGSRVALISCVVVLVLALGVGIDTCVNWGKAYAGVTVGGVDVSGMNSKQIKDALSTEFDQKMTDTTVTIFANEDARSYVNDAIAQAEDRAQAEQLSVDQARLNNQLWTTSPHELGGSIDYDNLAERATSVGRGDGGLFARLVSQFKGHDVQVEIAFDETQVEHLAQKIDDTLGDPRIDADISISNGWAAANYGHDGMMVNRSTLADKISTLVLDDSDDDTFIAQVESAPARTTYEQADQLARALNVAIADGAVFSYGNSKWTASSITLGTWISTTIEKKGNSWSIVPYIQADVAKPQIMKGILESSKIDPVAISFDKSTDGAISVHTDSDSKIPDVADAASNLNESLFGLKGKLEKGTSGSVIEVAVSDTTVEPTMTLDDALSTGLVTAVGSYTTEYSTYSGTESRNHNIHLAADLINDSIVKANGGRWSFNDVAGDCNEERGFQAAGTIIDGQYVDNIGGGICQVATTVFNAVYESGLDIVERHNHSLYLSSYPAGRDAAVSYPDLQLVWADETDSDVLLKATYTESSITVTLYSAPLDYSVSTEVGEWSEGEKYETIKKEDASLAKGQSYVKTHGQDGRSITVVRYVKDSTGAVVKTNTFVSNYDPLNEVVVQGPGTEDDDEDSKDSDSKKKANS